MSRIFLYLVLALAATIPGWSTSFADDDDHPRSSKDHKHCKRKKHRKHRKHKKHHRHHKFCKHKRHKHKHHKHCKHRNHELAVTVNFSWDPADNSSDPNNLVVVNGSFTRMGLLSETTNDVKGVMAGALIGRTKNESSTNVTTTAGTTTITTSVNAKSRNFSGPNGTVTIDGLEYIVEFKIAGDRATLLNVEETFSGPTFSQSLSQNKLTIPVVATMYTSDHLNCFQGFGVIRRESSRTESGGSAITFVTDELESELIGDTGLFKLELNRLERTVETSTP